MESLATASEILAQPKQLIDGMAAICHDVDALKRENLLQRNTSEEVVNNRVVDETADDSACSTPHLGTDWQ